MTAQACEPRNAWEAETLATFGPEVVEKYREAEAEVRAAAAARQRARNRAADEGLEAMPSFKRGDGK